MRPGPPALQLRPASRSTRPAGLLAALAAASLLAGCAEDFTPGSVVEDPRILALVAEPPELDGRVLGATTRVSAVEGAPPPSGAPPSGSARSWSFCPFTLGASTAFRCAVPACETPLTPAADGSVTVDPLALALQCLQDFGGTLPPGVLGGGVLPDQVEVVIRYRLVVPAQGARPELLREAVQRIPVWTTAPTAALNTSPAFASPAVSIGGAAATPCADLAQPGTPACPVAGTLAPGGRLPVEARVTPESFQDYPVGGRTATEALAVSFFTTAGRFTDERGAPTRDAPATSTELKDEKLAGDPRQVLVWAVVRDLRGGQAVAGPYLVVRPGP